MIPRSKHLVTAVSIKKLAPESNTCSVWVEVAVLLGILTFFFTKSKKMKKYNMLIKLQLHARAKPRSSSVMPNRREYCMLLSQLLHLFLKMILLFLINK